MNGSKRQVPRTLQLYGDFRVQAQAIWNGPVDIESRSGDGEPFYGWRTLHLEARSAESDQLETRIVYANLLDISQHYVIMRAVHWNGGRIKASIKQTGSTPPLILPARFVKLPAEQLRSWLSEFDGLEVTIRTALPISQLGAIKRLRIEMDYKTCVFEEIWQTKNDHHILLDQKWAAVWEHMTEILQERSGILSYDEDFRFVQPEFIYDLEAYSPSITI